MEFENVIMIMAVRTRTVTMENLAPTGMENQVTWPTVENLVMDTENRAHTDIVTMGNLAADTENRAHTGIVTKENLAATKMRKNIPTVMGTGKGIPTAMDTVNAHKS